MSYLFDPNFYSSIPLWVYITGGFGIVIIINSSVLCCYCCKITKRVKDLDLREVELRQRELMFNRKVELENNDIVITKPISYSDYTRRNF